LTRYRVDRELGRGGMAVVQAGWDLDLERPVALKVLAEHLAGDPEFRTRFLREARIAAGLDHPNLVRTYDVTELDGLPTIVMELVPRGTLQGGTLSRAEAASVADALAYAHARGVVHRDLKPANLLRASDGSVKIADFGIARAAEDTYVTQVGTVLGTLRYLSPEQAEGRRVGPEADVYSLGVVLDELLADAGREERELLARCTAREPAGRPTAADVAAALRGNTLVAPTRVLRGPPGRRGRTALLAVGAVTASAAGIAVAIASTGQSHTERVAPVPHATTPAQQARNLEAWLRRYSR